MAVRKFSSASLIAIAAAFAAGCAGVAGPAAAQAPPSVNDSTSDGTFSAAPAPQPSQTFPQPPVTPQPPAGLRGTQPPAASDGAGPPPSPSPALPAPQAAAPAADAGSANYGKPKPKKPKLYTPNAKMSPPLPPLVPYATAPGARKRRGSVIETPAEAAANATPGRALPVLPDALPGAPGTPYPDTTPVPPPPGPTVAVIPVLPHPPKPKPDDHPFDPVGIDIGLLRLTPFAETGLGYDSNPNRQATEVKGSAYWRGDAGFNLKSDWSQHSLTADLRAGYSDFFTQHNADRPDGTGKVVGRIDVTRDTQINLEGRFNLTTQQPGSPQIAVPGSTFIVNRPIIETYGTTAGVTEKFNRLSLSLRGTFDRTQSADATLSDGSTLALSTTDYNQYGLTGRAAYELTPGVIPFVEVTGDERHHDQHVDLYGFARDSNGLAGKVGSTFEFSRLLTGDLAFGYANRVYVDPRLPNLNGPTIDGSLVYTVTPLTTVTLRTGTSLSETTTAFASGAVSRNVGLEIGHSFFRNFTLTGIATYTNNAYKGQPISENYITAALRAEYNLNRELSLRASYSREQFITTLPGANYHANVFLLGVRLQR